MTSEPASFYRRLDATTFRPTARAQGVWRPTEQHMGPASGLLAHALETAFARDDMQLSRISFDILGVIGAEDTTVQVELVRPGRTIEMLEARLEIGGRTAVRATGWRLARFDTTTVAGGAAGGLPEPSSWPTWRLDEHWSGGYISTLDGRVHPDAVPGRAQAWLRTDTALIEGEEVSDLVTFTTLVDTANGVGARVPPRDWMFPNTDLTIHYFRTPSFAGAGPSGRWVGFDTTATFGPDGVGLTSSALFDAHGQVGRAEQILTLRRMPASDSGAAQ